MELDLSENVPLQPFSTLGVGGIARYYTEARRLDEVVGRTKTVPLDFDLLTTARNLGVSFGD